ncbi:hypothetical protein ACQEVF_31600 [Nonomuraea polychroma]|uniref:hypothetical protein n=1 Tax=Nonomuraea polychroma TaxID=46176 RepID=UPI003D8A957D
MVTVGAEGGAKLWDPASGKELGSIDIPVRTDAICAVSAGTLDGRPIVVAVGSDDETSAVVVRNLT